MPANNGRYAGALNVPFAAQFGQFAGGNQLSEHHAERQEATSGRRFTGRRRLRICRYRWWKCKKNLANLVRMAWYKIPLDDKQVSNGLESKIQEEFQALFIGSGQPKDMALFSSKPAADRVELFLSPAAFPPATNLVVNYGGVPCDKPERAGLTLLFGLQTALESS